MTKVSSVVDIKITFKDLCDMVVDDEENRLAEEYRELTDKYKELKEEYHKTKEKEVKALSAKNILKALASSSSRYRYHTELDVGHTI